MATVREILGSNLVQFKDKIIKNLSSKGTVLSEKTKAKIEIILTEISGKIQVPAWFPVFQTGRKPRKSTTNYGLYLLIWEWGKKRNIWKGKTVPAQIIEAKQMTWYINKYGTKLFRNKEFRDIYQSDIIDFENKILKELTDKWISDLTFLVNTELNYSTIK